VTTEPDDDRAPGQDRESSDVHVDDSHIAMQDSKVRKLQLDEVEARSNLDVATRELREFWERLHAQGPELAKGDTVELLQSTGNILTNLEYVKDRLQEAQTAHLRRTNEHLAESARLDHMKEVKERTRSLQSAVRDDEEKKEEEEKAKQALEKANQARAESQSRVRWCTTKLDEAKEELRMNAASPNETFLR
jgi:tetrahydrodipicolinate N-succinyltransferase